MIDLEAVRARVRLHQGQELNLPNTSSETLSRWDSWEQDVPALLAVIDAMTPLVVAARNFVQGDGDKDALEALVEAADRTPWTVLDVLGIGEDE